MFAVGVTLTMPTDEADVIGQERLRAIGKVLANAARDEIELSVALAISGALRWPVSMRPEVLVAADVRAV